MNGHTFDTEYLLEQYELLRREALEVSPHTQRGYGLLLFLTRGMVAWIEAVSCLSGRQVRDDGVHQLAFTAAFTFTARGYKSAG